MSHASPPVPNGKTYGWLALAFMAFVVYGSWVPFNFRPLPLGQAVTEFREVMTGPLRLPSRSDWVANVLLMVPVSFLLMGALGADRSRAGAVGDAVLILPVCLLLSAVVEFGQLFLPERLCSLNDIAAQGIGAALGAAGWVALGQRVTEWGRRFWGAEAVSPAARLLPGYLVMLGIVYLLPLDLTLSPGELYHKFKAGVVNLIPFAPPAGDPYTYAEKTAFNLVYMGVLGLLLAGLPGRDRSGAGRVFALAIGIVVALNCLKLLVASRSFDVTDVLLGVVAVVVGWRAGLSLRERGADWREALGLRAVLLAAWLVLATFATWRPFDIDPDLVGERLAALSFVPFADLWRGDAMLALRGVVEKLVLYLPLGVLLTAWRSAPGRREWLLSLAVGFVIALILEAGQLFLTSRTANLSDIYVEAAGAVIGSLIVQRVRRSERARRESWPTEVQTPARRGPYVFGGRR